MSVTSVKEFGRGRRVGVWEGDIARSESRWFYVKTDTKYDGPMLIALAGELPLVGSLHPDFDTMVCVALVPHEERTEYKYIVEAKYMLTPWLEPPVVHFNGERVEKFAERDLDNKLYANSAGDFFAGGAQLESGIGILEYEDNAQFFDGLGDSGDVVDGLGAGVGSDDYLYKANSVIFLRRAIKSVLMVNFSGRQTYRNGIKFFRRAMTFKLDRNGDWTKLTNLDKGFNYLDGTSRVPFVSAGAGPYEWFLDGSGGPRSLADVLANTVSTIDFRVKGTMDFNLLNLKPF